MAEAYIDVGTLQEISVIQNLQAGEDLTWDGKYYWSLKSGDIIQSDPNGGEVYRFAATVPSHGTLNGLTFNGKYLIAMDDDGAGLNSLITYDAAGNVVRNLKIISDSRCLCFLDKYFMCVTTETDLTVFDYNGTQTKPHFHTSVDRLHGLAFDGKNVYASSATGRVIYQLDLAGNILQIIRPANNPVGPIVFSGRYLVYTF